MKLNEAVLKLKQTKNNIVKKFNIYDDIINSNLKEELISEITSDLQAYSEFESKILKTNLSYQAEIKNADDEIVKITLQELYRMIQNNIFILNLFQKNLNIKEFPYDWDEKMIFSHKMSNIEKINILEDRINYLKNVLQEADITVDLID